jgi:Zinc finger, C2H2 type/Zinc-finger of C2H2 type
MRSSKSIGYPLHFFLISTKFSRCDVCQHTFERRRALNLHKKSHKIDGKEFQCHYCSKMYTSKNVLELHLLGTHAPDEEKKFHCNTCGNRYPSRKHLNQHVRVVHNVEQHICEICAKVCKSRSSYVQHKVCMHSEEGKRPTIQCPDCRKWLKGSTVSVGKNNWMML